MSKAIVKRNYKGIEGDLIFMNRAHGYYFPCTNSVCVYDREKDNVVICNDLYDEEDTRLFSIPRELNKLPEVRVLTISQQVLESIKSLIRESGVMDIRSFENVDYHVLDGEANTFYFGVDDNKKLIKCNNFYMLYSNGEETPKAGKVMKLVENVEEVLRKEVKW